MRYLAPRIRPFLGAAAALAVASGLSAQTSPSSPPAASAEQREQVLTLPEFSVQAASASGAYTAGDTISASRMNASVKDLPYSVSSMTAAFMQDFQIFDLNENINVMSAVTGNSDAFTYSLRGYNSANVALFNGHYMFNPVIAPFVDRIEVIKGPAGSLYGQSSPGGAVLITTKQPTSIAHDSMSLTYGAYNLRQSTLDSSGPIPLGSGSPKLFYNLDGEYLHRTYDVHDIRRQEKALEGGLLFRPDENTNISIEGVWQKIWNPSAADWGLPLAARFGNNPDTGKTGQIFYTGFAWPLRKAYYGSTRDYLTREASTYYTTVQHRFSDWLSLEAGYSHYVTPVECYNTLGSSGVYFPSAGLVASTTAASGTNNVNPSATSSPAWSTTMGTGYSYNIDLLSHFPIGSKIDNQLLFTVDDYLNNRRNYTETAIAGTFTPYVWAFNPFAGSIVSPYVPRDGNHWVSTNTLNNAVNSLGGGLNDRMSLLGGKLILTFGYRHDHYTGSQLNPSAALSTVAYVGAAPGSGRSSHIFSDNDGGNFGITYQITPSMSAYGSIYQAFTPFNTSVPLTVTLTPGATQAVQAAQLKTLDPSPQKGVGEEVGLKFDYLNHTVNFTVDAYNTQQKNISITELSDPNNASSPTITVFGGNQNAKGIEFEGGYDKGGSHTYLSYSYLDSWLSNQGVNVLANDQRPRGAPKHSLSAGERYELPQVKGLSLTLQMHYQSWAPEQSPSSGAIINPATGLEDANNGMQFLRTPSYAVWNLGAIYRWKTPGLKVTQSINLQVKNVFDKQYLPSTNSTLFVGDGRGLYATYRLNY